MAAIYHCDGGGREEVKILVRISRPGKRRESHDRIAPTFGALVQICRTRWVRFRKKSGKLRERSFGGRNGRRILYVEYANEQMLWSGCAFGIGQLWARSLRL
jgi:hypothetical protein